MRMPSALSANALLLAYQLASTGPSAIAGCGVGNRDGIVALRRCAGEEINLPDRSLGFGTARIGIQDNLIRLLRRGEIAGLELLAGLGELGVEFRGILRSARALELSLRRR